MKTIIVACVLILIGVNGNQKDLDQIDSINSEEPCTNEGGLCVIAKDCPKGKSTKKLGLCPMQQKKGVECCYGVSVKETRCGKQGGSCAEASMCHPTLIINASDCHSGEICCVYI